ncbi:MAG: hypothetical protein A2351_07100 [Omnitrophica bacterium RIFOXYB12_FULL_50_7]|nr:MAG: hypothetical protein A2351_07100 [Omnitrophica bacterium RIFOXYB12_FULL_50_7]
MISHDKCRVGIYARVSTGHQDVQMQLMELREVAIQRNWTVIQEYVDDGYSGSRTDRPALSQMMDAARSGKLDLIAVWKLDRLGRSLQHLLQVLDELAHHGVGFISLRDSGIDTTTAQGKLMVSIIGAFAEFEKSLIVERVRAGVARAQANGTHCGRPVLDFDLRPVLLLREKGHSIRDISTMLGQSRGTVWRRLRDEQADSAPEPVS